MPILIALTPFKFAGVRVPQGAVVDVDQAGAEELRSLKLLGPAPEDAKPTVTLQPASGFPTDFPGKEALEAAGYTEPAELEGKSAEELGAIKGIGPKTVDKLLALLKEA